MADSFHKTEIPLDFPYFTTNCTSLSAFRWHLPGNNDTKHRKKKQIVVK